MARRTSISYWPSRKGGGYFCIYKGKRYELALGPDDAPSGHTYLKAHDAFKAIMQEKPKEHAPTVVEIFDDYLTHIKKNRKPGTVAMRQQTILPFCNHGFAMTEAESLTHMDVYRFLERMERPRYMKRKVHQPGRKPIMWGPSTQRNCVVGLVAMLNWAVRSGLIAKNPLTGIEKPGASSRGAESLVGNDKEEAEANHGKILAAVPPSYRPFIQALKDTGARPGELAAATAEDFNPSLGAFVFHKEMTRRSEQFAHKTAKKKDRVIFLSGPTLDHVKELVAKHASGPLFRRKSGKRFLRVHVNDRFLKLQKKLKMPSLTAYSYRHQFATDMLKAGMDVDTLAELMGNSPMVIRQHYSHLLSDKKGLRAKLERFLVEA